MEHGLREHRGRTERLLGCDHIFLQGVSLCTGPLLALDGISGKLCMPELAHNLELLLIRRKGGC